MRPTLREFVKTACRYFCQMVGTSKAFAMTGKCRRSRLDRETQTWYILLFTDENCPPLPLKLPFQKYETYSERIRHGKMHAISYSHAHYRRPLRNVHLTEHEMIGPLQILCSIISCLSSNICCKVQLTLRMLRPWKQKVIYAEMYTCFTTSLWANETESFAVERTPKHILERKKIQKLQSKACTFHCQLHPTAKPKWYRLITKSVTIYIHCQYHSKMSQVEADNT